jgi:hypothetical protein
MGQPTNLNTCATRSRPWRPPATHRGDAAECPLEQGSPRSRAERPLRRGPPRSRAIRPLGRGPPCSRAGRPLGRVRPARGLNAPSGEDRLARGHLHARRPRTCPRVRAFNALTPQDARHDPDTPGNRVPALFHRLPGGGHPHRCLALCDEAGVSPVTLRRLPPYG